MLWCPNPKEVFQPHDGVDLSAMHEDAQMRIIIRHGRPAL